MSKQCVCGRSLTYPYCDGTHKTPNNFPIVQTINPQTFTYFSKDENNPIVQIPKFISKDFSKQLIDLFNSDDKWQGVGFHKAKNLMKVPDSADEKLSKTWEDLLDTIKRATHLVFKKEIELQQVYVQTWPKDSYGVIHNDTHNYDGTISNINYKFATILFLYSDFVGGRLEFPAHNISIDPKQGSLYLFDGGAKNEHQVTTVEDGLRYTVIAFWDIAGTEYTDEQKIQMQASKDRWADYYMSKKDNNE